MSLGKSESECVYFFACCQAGEGTCLLPTPSSDLQLAFLLAAVLFPPPFPTHKYAVLIEFLLGTQVNLCRHNPKINWKRNSEEKIAQENGPDPQLFLGNLGSPGPYLGASVSVSKFSGYSSLYLWVWGVIRPLFLIRKDNGREVATKM